MNVWERALMSSHTVVEIPVPLPDDGFAAIVLPAQMTEEGWDRLMAILSAYKDGIVLSAMRGEDNQ